MCWSPTSAASWSGDTWSTHGNQEVAYRSDSARSNARPPSCTPPLGRLARRHPRTRGCAAGRLPGAGSVGVVRRSSTRMRVPLTNPRGGPHPPRAVGRYAMAFVYSAKQAGSKHERPGPAGKLRVTDCVVPSASGATLHLTWLVGSGGKSTGAPGGRYSAWWAVVGRWGDGSCSVLSLGDVKSGRRLPMNL